MTFAKTKCNTTQRLEIMRGFFWGGGVNLKNVLFLPFKCSNYAMTFKRPMLNNYYLIDIDCND